jgi:general secretion pathway protein G
MGILKILVGFVCFIAAFLTGCLALLGLFNLGTETLRNFRFASVLTLIAIGLARSGWELIAKRRVPLPGKFRILIVLTLCLFTGFAVAFVIPGFVAASLARSSNACVNNLRVIDGAKQQWALENGKTNGIVTWADIKPYLNLDSNGDLPKCPQGGTYTIGRLGEDPTCSVGTSDWPNTHALNYTDGSWWINFKMAYGKLLGLGYAKVPQQNSKDVR